MRNKIVLFFFLEVLLSLSYTHAVINRKERDSLFRVANSISQDTLRSRFLRSAFEQHIGQKGATEYLDSAIVFSVRKKLHEEEIWALFDYCRHYEYLADPSKLQQKFIDLKEASYRHGIYEFYYTMWLGILQARCSQGDTEYAILQAKEMRAEAIRLNYTGGRFIGLLALAQAHSSAGQADEAIAAYLQALRENPKSNSVSKLMIYGKLADIYYEQKKYKEALDTLDLQLKTAQEMMKGVSLSDTYKATLLGIEISFCKVYMALEDEQQLNRHLRSAKIYYHKDIYQGAYIDYHGFWGGYYKLIKEWDKCLESLDLALAACRGMDPFNENRILKMKAAALMEVGRYEEAAKAYRATAIKGDSLNKDILQRHKEAHQSNFKIQNALIQKEELIKQQLYVTIFATAIVLILMIIVVVRAIRIRYQLQRSEEGTRQAFETMKAADKMKERFLHNITYEIRIPLNTVVGFSELLSEESGLTEAEIEEYSVAVKSNATKLLLLINNILDLSRLEAGMMRFNVQEDDVVQLCREAKMMIAMQQPGMVEATFITDIEELQIQVDSKWFLKLLTSLMVTPNEYKGEVCKIEYMLAYTDAKIKMIVRGSPLYHCWEDEQEKQILHDINRLYVELFKGTYQVLGEEGNRMVSIVLPVQ